MTDETDCAAYQEKQNLEIKRKQGNWCAPDNVKVPMDVYFSENELINANTVRLTRITLRHHQRSGGDFTNTAIRIPFTIGAKCNEGKYCQFNHRSRPQLANIKDDKNNVKRLIQIFTAIYK